MGPDAFEQQAGWFVVRVLGHQFATKGLGQDALGQAVDARLGRGDLGFQLVGKGEELLDAADDFGLLSCWWNRKWKLSANL
ncbi:hypothetical protein [Aquipseudomonas alcaligenes]|uniref:hypothetical protein n=1 Tax=Aquipseudomonas alcaligenes TaxID=43263 RepID=UPI0015598FAD|nr:hypothetical protein [Pseudomonas alcaligenes]